MRCEHHSVHKHYHPNDKKVCINTSIGRCKKDAKWFYLNANNKKIHICGLHKYGYNKTATKCGFDLCKKALPEDNKEAQKQLPTSKSNH